MSRRVVNRKPVRAIELSKRTGISIEKLGFILFENVGKQNLYLSNSTVLNIRQLELVAKYFVSVAERFLEKIYKKRDALSTTQIKEYERFFNLFVWQKSSDSDLESRQDLASVLSSALLLRLERPRNSNLSIEEIFELGLNSYLLENYFFDLVCNSFEFNYPKSLVWREIAKEFNQKIIINCSSAKLDFNPIFFSYSYHNFSDDNEDGSLFSLFPRGSLCLNQS